MEGRERGLTDTLTYLSKAGTTIMHLRANGLELDEAYADIYLNLFDLRIGRQLVSWGTAYAS